MNAFSFRRFCKVNLLLLYQVFLDIIREQFIKCIKRNETVLGKRTNEIVIKGKLANVNIYNSRRNSLFNQVCATLISFTPTTLYFAAAAISQNRFFTILTVLKEVLCLKLLNIPAVAHPALKINK